jgi:protein-ribulosamine 3-kinase
MVVSFATAVTAAALQPSCIRTRAARTVYMSLPDSIADPVVDALRRQGFGRVLSITDVSPLPGLSTRHVRYDTIEGPVFCKRCARPAAAADAEAASLRVLRQAALAGGMLRVPEPLASGSLPLGGSFLLQEWLDPGFATLPSDSVLEQLGHGIAALHSAPQPPPRRGFGFECNTFLGTWQQDNTWSRAVADFFVRRRLEPLLNAVADSSSPASKLGTEERRALRRLTDPVLAAAEALLCVLASPPALLHGDLRLENVRMTADQQPVLHSPVHAGPADMAWGWVCFEGGSCARNAEC